MKNSEIDLKEIISADPISTNKIKCSKCGGSGNFKTSENSRRTCLVCFGKGYINCWYCGKINSKNICLLIKITFYFNLN